MCFGWQGVLGVFWGVGVPGKRSWPGAGSAGAPGHEPGVGRTGVWAGGVGTGTPAGAAAGAGERSCSFSTSAHLCTPARTPACTAGRDSSRAGVCPSVTPGEAGAGSAVASAGKGRDDAGCVSSAGGAPLVSPEGLPPSARVCWKGLHRSPSPPLFCAPPTGLWLTECPQGRRQSSGRSSDELRGDCYK